MSKIPGGMRVWGEFEVLWLSGVSEGMFQQEWIRELVSLRLLVMLLLGVMVRVML